MTRSFLALFLFAALLLVPAARGVAQSPTQPAPTTPQPVTQPPPPAPPQAAPPGTTQPTAAGTTQPEAARPRRQGPSGVAPRTSNPKSSSRSPGVFAANRTPRPTETVRQQLTLTANLLGGYDDNVGASLGSGSSAVPGLATNGSTGYADVALDYFRGTSARSLRVGGLGNLRMYPDYLDDPAIGGLATVEAQTPLGRSHKLRVGQQVRYEPLFTAGVASGGGVPPPPGIGDTVPTTGLFERQSWISTTTVSLDREWSRRNSTRFAYDYFVQRFTDDERGGNDYHQGTVEFRRRHDRAWTLRTSYQYLDGRYTGYDTDTRPRREHRIEGGPEYTKDMRRQRRLTLSLGAGATYIESVSTITDEPFDEWAPSGSARVALDLPPSWALDGYYERRYSVLQGLTDQLYATDFASVTTRRLLTSRLDLGIGGTFNTGRTPVASGVDERFDVYGASARLRFALTSTVAAQAGYFFYQHRYSNPDALPTGFPARYDRNAFRVGLTMFVPLVGQTASPRPPIQ